MQSHCDNNNSPFDQSKRSVISSSNSYNIVQQQVLVGEPKRPLGAYNIFFIFQRKRIVDDDVSLLDRVVTMEEVIEFINHQRIVRSCLSNNKPRRLHRKIQNHAGKIGFRELTRLLAEKWKKLCPINKQMY